MFESVLPTESPVSCGVVRHMHSAQKPDTPHEEVDDRVIPIEERSVTLKGSLSPTATNRGNPECHACAGRQQTSRRTAFPRTAHRLTLKPNLRIRRRTATTSTTTLALRFNPFAPVPGTTRWRPIPWANRPKPGKRLEPSAQENYQQPGVGPTFLFVGQPPHHGAALPSQETEERRSRRASKSSTATR
jgi:hypothetical protein